MNAFLRICRQCNTNVHIWPSHFWHFRRSWASLPIWEKPALLQTAVRICARVPCLERHTGDSGVTHYCRNEEVGSTSHMSWMRNLMWHWSSPPFWALRSYPSPLLCHTIPGFSASSTMSSRLFTDGIFLEGIIAMDEYSHGDPVTVCALASVSWTV